MDYRKLFADVHRRPGMFTLDGSFHDFTVFIRGCEAGNDWQLLAGFREWLVTRCGRGDNLIWEALVLHQAFPDGPPQREQLEAEAELNRVAVEALFRLLDEYLQRRTEHGGLANIFDEYVTWRKTQSWS
ncbi:hypothetical protein [Micromonospora echinofusca]|uniref:hypothetical protein n=1 Tax=Micromonospora echinofusca TaxID=47858 RepID=UPI0037224EC0